MAVLSGANIWQWRSDIDMASQVTYDLSGNPDHTLYWSCPFVVGEHDAEDDTRFVNYNESTGVTLHNEKMSHRDCLMRKSKIPVDLSKIGRIEVDVRAIGKQKYAPWYALWLAPMDYSFVEGSVSAEINLIENRNASTYWGNGSNNAHSSFPSCAPCGPDEPCCSYCSSYCKPLSWSHAANDIDHHITLAAREDAVIGRIIEIRHCPNEASPMPTCSAKEFAEIHVTRPNLGAPDWFPIWNETRMGDRFGHYWLVSDIWHTSNSDFTFSVSNVRFFLDDGSEWFIPPEDSLIEDVVGVGVFV